MIEERELARKIIERFRSRSEWQPNHRDMLFGKTRVEYYDTSDKDDYFTLKYDNIEFTLKNVTGYSIDFSGGRRQNNFNLLNWLRNLDIITKPEMPKVIIDGIEYQPVA